MNSLFYIIGGSDSSNLTRAAGRTWPEPPVVSPQVELDPSPPDLTRATVRPSVFPQAAAIAAGLYGRRGAAGSLAYSSKLDERFTYLLTYILLLPLPKSMYLLMYTIYCIVKKECTIKCSELFTCDVSSYVLTNRIWLVPTSSCG